MTSSAALPSHAVGAWHHLRAIVLLPVMNTVVIPTCLVLLTGDGSFGLNRPVAYVGLALFAGGVLLVWRSIALFVYHGEGTLAPWDPTHQLVIEGLYRHVRNPMKLGLFTMLLAESLLLGSRTILVWLAIFATVNVVYIRCSEEPGLMKRFGSAYMRYRSNVPAWFPRRRPWIVGSDGVKSAADLAQ